MIEVHPERGRLISIADIREVFIPVGASAYVLRYAYATEKKEIIVLRVWCG